MNKTYSNTTASQAKDDVSDIKFWGNGDTWKLISKAWSEKEGWMKSTKAMQVDDLGCVLQVTTQQNNNIAESIIFIPNVIILESYNGSGDIVGRYISNK